MVASCPWFCVNSLLVSVNPISNVDILRLSDLPSAATLGARQPFLLRVCEAITP